MQPEPPEKKPWLENIPVWVANAGTALSYLYLLRVPILMALILMGLPPLAVYADTRAIAGNLFLLRPANVFFTMIAAFMLAWSILVVTRVVLLNGARFKVPPALRRDELNWWWMSGVFVLVVPMLAGTVAGPSLDGDWPWRLCAALGGLLVAYVAGCVTLVVAVLCAPKYSVPARDRFPHLLPRFKDAVQWAYEQPILKKEQVRKLGEIGQQIPEDLSSGYLDSSGILFPGQWFSVLMLITSFLLFWVIGFWKQNHLGESDFPVPAIAYVLLVLLVTNWILSMAAFQLDRFRVPLLLPLAILCTIGNSALRSDHYYSVQRGIAIKSINPALVLTASSRVGKPSLKHPHGRVVVVATAGGGIQAAAWTARVLTGLQQQLPEFANSIAALSAVSGGAVGTMFFVNQHQIGYKANGFPTKPDTDIVEQAEASSLDDVAWALVYSDFFRIFFPYLRRSTEESVLDRGWALEQTWRNRGNIQASLSNWREGVLDGWRPAVLFDATIAETGQALLLSTSDLSPGARAQDRARTFSDLYPNTDLPVVTAVRLAATFPYVTPAARQVSEQPEYHVVDGGYYDNYGVFALLNWLDDALEESEPEHAGRCEVTTAPDILFIQIRSFPGDLVPKPENKGWFYQTYAPLDALFNVRTNQQRVRDQYELARFGERWSCRGVHLQYATFEFSASDAPLSWAMNPDQKNAIENAWSKYTAGPLQENAQVVQCFFRPEGCPNPPSKGPW